MPKNQNNLSLFLVNNSTMIISTEIYNEIIGKIRGHKGHCRELESSLALEYKIPKNTISSIISNENKRKIKKTHYKMNNITSKLFKRYLALKNEKDDPEVMLKLADEIDVPYTLLAKGLLEKYYEYEDSKSNESKSSNIKQYLKDSTLIEKPDLAYEVYLCQLYDSQYGNINDVIRHSLGQEYEYHLQKVVKEKNLIFQSEEDLRVYGYDKTPDIKLDIPFSVDGFIVNWIESKALFADLKEHENYMKEQYSSYWNRFGTGLVIYWLGMVDSVIDPSEKRFIVRDDFPQQITHIDPFHIAKLPTGVGGELSETNTSGNSDRKKEAVSSFKN